MQNSKTRSFVNRWKKNKYWVGNSVIGLVIVYFLFSGNYIYAIPGVSDTSPNDVANSLVNSLTEKEKQKIEEKVETLEDKIADKQEDLETLEQKAKNYQRMIDLKKQQQVTLQNQLSLMDVQIESMDNNIEITKKEISRNDEEISKLQVQVDARQKEMDKKKSQLAEMIRTYQQLDQELQLQLLSSKGDLAVILNSSEYLTQASQKLGDVLANVEQKKNELAAAQKVFDEKNEELKSKRMQLEEKIFYLNNEKTSKDVLLKETEGEEEKYQQMLARVEEQKQELIGDIDALSDDKRSELAKIKAEAPKPDAGTASTSWYYSQKDSTWGNNRIGLSSSLIKDYGCALTSVAMVFTYHGERITPGKMAQQPIFYRDLIVWPLYWKGLKLSGGHAHGNIDWDVVDKELKADNPVIVFVKARAGKGHYVVIHGKDKDKYVVHDPLFGPNLYLETTKKLVGAIYNTTTTIDQMIIYKTSN